jgi:hypothetical protein
LANPEPAFLVAEFAEPEQMLAAATALRKDGWPVELHAPFPVKGMREALGFADRSVPHAFVIGGAIGALGGFLLQVYTNFAYPLEVGGRSLVAVPAFMLITFELMVLTSVLVGIGTMLVKNGLPRLHHPLFDAERFGLASDDRFFVSAPLGDRDEDAARAALASHAPLSIAKVGGELPQ